MKRHFTTRGYLRTIVLSALAAFAIECCVNADEVKEAFVAGRNVQQATTATIQSSASEWLKVPQNISKMIGRIIRAVSED
jgi:hypothetical protein